MKTVKLPGLADAMQRAGILYFLACWLLCALAELRNMLSRNQNGIVETDEEMPEKRNIGIEVELSESTSDLKGAWNGHTILQLIKMDAPSLLATRPLLRLWSEFGAIMFIFILCDRTSIFNSTKKQYDRDLFLFLFLLLVIVAFGATAKQSSRSAVANRDQTEEWKGWMQVIFVQYHYWGAAEYYNLVRVFIAAYVWMTGYGNFTYYSNNQDFSLVRFCQMMWRLNFLAFFSCIMLKNSYMLYYICPLHTLFTLTTFASTQLGKSWNKGSYAVLLKCLIAVIAVTFLWTPSLFYKVWRPFSFLLGYADPRRPTSSMLHEWFFRTWLDRYIWIYGMLCASLHSPVQAFLIQIGEMQVQRRAIYQSCILLLSSVVLLVWYSQVYSLPKLDYNKLHPYTSWIPITIYLVLRNLTKALRSWNLVLFTWLGKITLETYIAQFHVWLHTGIPNGQPIGLLSIISGYKLMNYMVTTILYVYISSRLFHITVHLRDAIIVPDKHVLFQNAIAAVAISLVLLFLGSMLSATVSLLI